MTCDQHSSLISLSFAAIWIISSSDDDIRVPFGRYKQSGFGREMGAEGLDAYTITKSVHFNLDSKL
jgi:aldehyde dehydrogenase (NAD(P)+)